ncbi:dephospho-CoA kinase [Vagococcus lutrae]|uniref:dephospho-CoA kinase n=1 Tax=Vagococcus lutrae TaxID=81947 RepID=UPI00200C6222|nr:dephospho-CoA kinase [Vagococcus lutrae]MDT2800721.1 dephospho-CoA kinase [Vagococcus lutrae]MDT2805429.1 dephospho-CoA kinase [Vagococcus lutrae]MDT2816450.1 dephospho-CoA kinase [Vagococcus lutrae]MDT2823654.1 dephospho-CoA kinase [Vagococcus lutrae]MDT2825564.1 dephospho-CoA kinase [Vagococcus lutrae]
MTYTLGLTGGIATGKSTVTRFFRQHDIPVVDADVIAREVVEPGTDGLAEIIKTFGTEILLEDGSLNRKKLGEIIFKDEDKREMLNQILHQEIHQKMMMAKEKWENERVPLIVFDIPLLYEADYQSTFDAIMVVYVPEKTQIARLMERDELTVQQARDRIASQLPIEEKKARADIVIDNSQTIADTYEQVQNWLIEQFKTFK